VLLGGGKPVPYVLLNVTDLVRDYFKLNKIEVPDQRFHLFHTYKEYLPLMKESLFQPKQATRQRRTK